jgi:excisionase family DNA binding protein
MGEEDRARIMLSTLRTSQVAEMLGVGPTTVLKYERLGKIPPAFAKVGNQRRWRLEDVEAAKKLLAGEYSHPRCAPPVTPGR